MTLKMEPRNSASEDCVALRSHLDASLARCRELETQLTAQQRTSDHRLAEQQQRFETKVAAMHAASERLAQDAMSALTRELTAALAACASTSEARDAVNEALPKLAEAVKPIAWSRTEHETIPSRNVRDAAAAAVSALSLETRREAERAGAGRRAAEEEKAQAEAARQTAETSSEELRAQLREARATAQRATSNSSAASLEMVNMMERQLGNLAGSIRSKDAELAALNSTLQAQFAERNELQSTVANLRGQLERLQGSNADTEARLVSATEEVYRLRQQQPGHLHTGARAQARYKQRRLVSTLPSGLASSCDSSIASAPPYSGRGYGAHRSQGAECRASDGSDRSVFALKAAQRKAKQAQQVQWEQGPPLVGGVRRVQRG